MTPLDLTEPRDTGRPVMNAAATIMLLLWGIFLASGFTGSSGFPNQTAGQIFDVIAFWGQLIPIALSFSNPKLAARWIFFNVGLSIVLMMGVQAGTIGDYFDAVRWIESLEGPARSAFVFWLIPTLFAWLLWQVSHMKESLPTLLPAESILEFPDDPHCRAPKKLTESGSHQVRTLAS